MILPIETKLTDSKFDDLMNNYDNDLDRYVKNMLEDYISFYIATGYKLSSLFENNLDVIAYTAASLLEGSKKGLYDLNEIKKRLEENYKLRIMDDSRTTIEDIAI